MEEFGSQLCVLEGGDGDEEMLDLLTQLKSFGFKLLLLENQEVFEVGGLKCPKGVNGLMEHNKSHFRPTCNSSKESSDFQHKTCKPYNGSCGILLIDYEMIMIISQ